MNGIIAGAIAALVVGLPTYYISLLTLRQNKAAAAATNAIETRRVSRDEFETLKTELRQQLADAREAERRAEERAKQAEERAHQAEQKAERLDRRVDLLEAVMRAEGMTVPPAI